MSSVKKSAPTYRWLNRQSYDDAWQLLRSHANSLAEGESGEVLFCCEHEPVYTTGRRGIDNRLSELLPAPLVQSDRGGEMTFHGPGQIMLYPVIDLRSRELGVKQYVHCLEQSCINLLRESGIAADRNCGFPGVWTDQGKIAALGVRVTQGIAYHGMALNVDVESRWFAAINPCGLQSGVVSMSQFIEPQPLPELAEQWQRHLLSLL